MAQNGLRYAIEQVDQQDTLDRYAALYEELAAQKSRASQQKTR